MNEIILFLFRLFFPRIAARQNPPAIDVIRRQLREIEGKIELQLGLRYGAYSIADPVRRHERLDEIARTIHTLRENREQLRLQLGETCRMVNGCCPA